MVLKRHLGQVFPNARTWFKVASAMRVEDTWTQYLFSFQTDVEVPPEDYLYSSAVNYAKIVRKYNRGDVDLADVSLKIDTMAGTSEPPTRPTHTPVTAR